MARKRLETKDFKFTLTEMDDARGSFSGYASVFGEVDSYGDVVIRGAFRKTLRDKRQFPVLWSHNIMEPIGIIRGQEDERGLEIEGQLNLDVQRGREIRSLMKQGAVTGLSIGYQVIKDAPGKEPAARELREINLWEISPCVFPACEPARVGEVKLEDLASDGFDLEERLEAGFGPEIGPDELKPYPNEHAARLQDPDKFDKFRRKADGTLFNTIKVPETIDIIWGHLKGAEADEWAAASLRFPTSSWTAEEARAWLKKNDIKATFEPASEEPEKSTPPAEAIKPETLHLLDEALRNLRRASEIFKEETLG